MSVKEMVMIRSRGNLYLTHNRILVIFVVVIHGFVTWICQYFIWLLFVMGVMHEKSCKKFHFKISLRNRVRNFISGYH